MRALIHYLTRWLTSSNPRPHRHSYRHDWLTGRTLCPCGHERREGVS